jgi:hypothetical protein
VNDMGVMSVKKVYVIDAAGLSTSGGMSNQRVELVNDGVEWLCSPSSSVFS